MLGYLNAYPVALIAFMVNRCRMSVFTKSYQNIAKLATRLLNVSFYRSNVENLHSSDYNQVKDLDRKYCRVASKNQHQTWLFAKSRLA